MTSPYLTLKARSECQALGESFAARAIRASLGSPEMTAIARALRLAKPAVYLAFKAKYTELRRMRNLGLTVL